MGDGDGLGGGGLGGGGDRPRWLGTGISESLDSGCGIGICGDGVLLKISIMANTAAVSVNTKLRPVSLGGPSTPVRYDDMRLNSLAHREEHNQ